jgi:hypothetical protein
MGSARKLPLAPFKLLISNFCVPSPPLLLWKDELNSSGIFQGMTITIFLKPLNGVL